MSAAAEQIQKYPLAFLSQQPPNTPMETPGKTKKAPYRPDHHSLLGVRPLWAAEAALISACRLGIQATIAEDRPSQPTPDNKVRAVVVRFLLLGGDSDTPVHELGVRLRGAWLIDTLDLNYITAAVPLLLINCVIEHIDARRSILKSLNFSGCALMHGFDGDGLRCAGDIFLRSGFESGGPIRLISADVQGDLDCNDARLNGANEDALSCDGARIGRTIHFSGQFTAYGEVHLVQATIGGSLESHGGRFDGAGGKALNCERAVIGDQICLRDQFHAVGSVILDGARIGGDVVLEGSSFDGIEAQNQSSREKQRGSWGVALSLRSAKIGGTLVLKGVTRIDGPLDMSDLQVTRLCDEPGSWLSAGGKINIDGFRYERLSDGAPVEAQSRIAWLMLQMSDHLGMAFRPQPWDQLVSVLRTMGHPEQARTVAIAKQDQMRRAGKIVFGGRAVHWVYGRLFGYGHRPSRLFLVSFLVWLVCALAFHLAAPPHIGGAIIATNSALGTDTFNPWMYSLDVLLPIIDFGQAGDFKVNSSTHYGQVLRWLSWFEIAFGWFAGALIATLVGTLLKKE